jgi:hypothetical protein
MPMPSSGMPARDCSEYRLRAIINKGRLGGELIKYAWAGDLRGSALPESGQVIASQRNDAMCHKRTHAPRVVIRPRLRQPLGATALFPFFDRFAQAF